MSPPVLLHAPSPQTTPLILTSAHSGRDYPAAFIAAAQLDPISLRRSEDCFVDELFAAAPSLGAPLLAATFPRAFCDPNREQWELDPTMFDEALPSWVNTASSRARAGLGTLARIVASGETIHRRKLPFAEAQHRVQTCWQPFHAALATLIEDTCRQFGHCLLLDCHSMPTPLAGPARSAPDFVLGDAHGTSCNPGATRAAEATLLTQGYRVARNEPYAGGYITRHYGKPRQGVHTLQIEIARTLYMDENRIERGPGLPELQTNLADLIKALTQWAIAEGRQGQGSAPYLNRGDPPKAEGLWKPTPEGLA